MVLTKFSCKFQKRNPLKDYFTLWKLKSMPPVVVVADTANKRYQVLLRLVREIVKEFNFVFI